MLTNIPVQLTYKQNLPNPTSIQQPSPHCIFDDQIDADMEVVGGVGRVLFGCCCY